jgi:iron(III) transport system permease protein
MASTTFSGRAPGARPRRSLRARLAALPWAVGIPALAVAALALLPLGFVVGRAATVGWSQIVALLARPHVATLLEHTVGLTAASTAACAVIGTAAAFCVERTELPGRRAWAVLAALPITVPAFVNGYAWVSLTPAFEGFLGAFVVVTLSYYPFVYLPVAAALRGMDPGLEESARSLGCGPWRVFTRVTLPHARPALLGGALIVALHLLQEFGAFSMLRFDTFTTAIYQQYQLSFDGPAASLLAAVLLVLCLLLLGGEVGLRGRARYARVGSGAARALPHRSLGRARVPALAGFAVLVGAGLGVPLGTVSYWLARGGSASFDAGSFLGSAGASLGLGLAAAGITTLLALPVGVLAVRHRSKLATLTERSTYVAHALPGIVIALALVFVAIRYVQPAYQTVVVLLAAYAILFLPMAMIAVRAALAQSPPALTDAARSLGLRPIAAMRRVTLPLIGPGLGAAAALVFLSTVTELTATLLLAPTGTTTLATQVWTDTTSLSYAAAAPFAALMVLISAGPTYLLTRKLGAAAAS